MAGPLVISPKLSPWPASAVACVLFACASAASAASTGGASSRPLPEPAWRGVEVWRQSQGLPQATIISIAQTRDGYLWVGTRAGLSRFDGVRFTSIRDPRNDVAEYEVWAIAEAADSSLWFATYGGGIGRLRRGELTSLTTAQGLANDFVTSLCLDAQGRLWAGTEGGLSRLHGDRFTNYTEKDGLLTRAVRSLSCAPDGTVWIGPGRIGLNWFRDGQIGGSVLPDTPAKAVLSITPAPDGGVWVGATDALRLFKDGVWSRFGAAEGLPETREFRTYRDPRGDLWAGHGAGLSRYADGRFIPYEVGVAGTLKRNVTALCGDREGSLWLGSGESGLVRLSRGQFVSYTMKDGLSANYVRTVIGDRRGDLWIGTSGGLDRFHDGILQTIAPAQGKVERIASLAEDGEGNIWLGTDLDVYRLRPPTGCSGPRCVTEFVRLDPGDIPRLNVRTLYVDRAGRLWIGTDQQGLIRHERGQLTQFTTRDGLADNDVRGLGEDAEGSLWIGTKAGGLNRYKDGRFELFTEANGLGSRLIQNVYTGSDGSVWVATRNGLSRWKDGRFVTLGSAQGLYDRHVYDLREDGHGNLWMSSGRGVFRVRRRELDDLAIGQATSVSSVNYGIEHGLNSTVGPAGYGPAIARAADGRLWFGTADGISVIDPAHLSGNTLPPPVHIEEAVVNGTALDVAKPADVPPGRGDLVFRYAALSFLAPLKVRFKVKLEPYDKDWVDVQTLRVMQYRNVPPGQYRFRVIACNNDGLWNEEGASFDLKLRPHFYQTRTFLGLCAAAAALLGAATQRLRIRHLKARQRELAMRVDQALDDVKVLHGLLPICAWCKKVRDDHGYWNQIETYIGQRSRAAFTHGICPECRDRQLHAQHVAEERAR